MCIVCPGLITDPGVSRFTSSLALFSSLAALAALPSFAVTAAAALSFFAPLLPSLAAAALSSLALFSSVPSNQGCAARREACVTKKQASSSRIKNLLTTQGSRFTAPPLIHPGPAGTAARWDDEVESTTRGNDYKHEGVLQSLKLVKYLL